MFKKDALETLSLIIFLQLTLGDGQKDKRKHHSVLFTPQVGLRGWSFRALKKTPWREFSDINCSLTFKTMSTAKQCRKIVLFQKQL